MDKLCKLIMLTVFYLILRAIDSILGKILM